MQIDSMEFGRAITRWVFDEILNIEDHLQK